MSEREREVLAERFDEAGLDVERFINVTGTDDSDKGTLDHTRYGPEDVSGNYGIYARGDDALAILDVDDYGDIEDKSGLTALAELPPTLEQESPHGGTHRPYAVEADEDGRPIADVLSDVFGSKQGNVTPSWGEARVSNQYVLGAGSQLTRCDKDGCDKCATDEGGKYELREDREIATVTAEELVTVLEADPSLSRTDDEDQQELPATDVPETPEDVEERLTYARERDDKLDRLMRGDYSDYRDSDADDGVDRSKAEAALAFKLAFWLGPDRRTVERVIEHDANTKKWDERTDDSYRDWVLGAVDNQTEFYEPGKSSAEPSYAPDVDWDEVDRGEAILAARKEITDPAGGLIHRNGCYGYNEEREKENGDVYYTFKEVTNFTLETVSYVKTYEGTLITIRVHPASPIEDPYEVEIHPTVFNTPATFKEEVVRGRTTRFNPQGRHNKAMNDLRLTVGAQAAPDYVGTEYIGLHGDAYDEWVSPVGTLTADGWADEPRFKYYEKGGDPDMQSSLEEKWELDPKDGADFDPETVRAICERLPKTRLPDRGLPVLGWFYAAPLKPYIHDWEGEFNLLQLQGGTETGKTSTLEMYYRLLGADPTPFGCGDKAFTIEKKLSASCGLPIWLDEYKPSDIAGGKLKWLHRRLREVTREKSVSKGTQDLGEITFRMRAPVVFSGEQSVQEAAVRRRTVMTSLSSRAKELTHRRAYCELTGTSYEDDDGNEHYPPSLDLGEHARAYYRHITALSPAELREAWKGSRKKTTEHLRAVGVGAELDGSEFQGLQTIVFGVGVFRQFATIVGVDEADLPTDAEVRGALEHVVTNIGPGGRRREHIDEFTELIEQAAGADYLEEGVHYRVYEPQKFGEAVAFHMPTTFSAIKKFVREYNLEDEYTILGKSDYVDNYGDKAASSESYALATNHRVRYVENGEKCVLIDPERADEVLPSGFNLSALTDTGETIDVDSDEAESLADLATPIANLSPKGNPYDTVTAEVVSWGPTNDEVVAAGGPAETGEFRDESGVIDVVDFHGASGGESIDPGGQYLLENVRVGTYNETLQLEITAATEATPIQPGVGNTSHDDPDSDQQLTAATEDAGDETAAADGGSTVEEYDGPKGKVRAALIDTSDGRLSLPALMGKTSLEETALRDALSSMLKEGSVHGSEEDGFALGR